MRVSSALFILTRRPLVVLVAAVACGVVRGMVRLKGLHHEALVGQEVSQRLDQVCIERDGGAGAVMRNDGEKGVERS